MSHFLLLFVIYISFISLGLPDSMLGTAWPLMHTDLNIGVSVAGLVGTVVSIGTVISSLLYSRNAYRIRTEVLTFISILMTAISLLLFSISTSFLVLLPIAILLGLGAGAVDASLNNYVSQHYKSNVMGFLHAFWGIGTMVAPLLFSHLFSNGVSWRTGYFSIGLFQILISIIVFSSFPLWKKEKGEIYKEDTGEERTKIRIKDVKGVIPAMLSFFTYSAVEQTMMLWAPTFLVFSRNLSSSIAASTGGMLFFGITVGRLATGLFSDKFRSKTLIRTGEILIFVGILMLLFLSEELIWIAIFVYGLGCAPIYPMLVYQTAEIFPAQQSSFVLGLEMAASYVSVALMPNLFGFIGERISLSLLPLFVLIFLILNIISVTSVLKKRSK